MHRYPALFELPTGFLSTKETLVASVSTSHSHCLISQLEKEVKLQGVVSTILTNGVLNLAGMGATILGLQVPAWHGSVPWCLGKGSCLNITGSLLARHVFVVSCRVFTRFPELYVLVHPPSYSRHPSVAWWARH